MGVVLQALVLLAARPEVGTTIAYDFRASGTSPGSPSLEVRVTERFDLRRADGTYETSRLYSNVSVRGGKAKELEGVQSISGKRDRYTVGKDGEWKPATPNTELGFPDFPVPATAVAVGHLWESGQNLRGVRARLRELRTIAGRSAAVIDFLPKSDPPAADRVGSGSYWVLDLVDGRPLFARIEMLDPNPAHSGVFSLVRRDVPGLVPKL